MTKFAIVLIAGAVSVSQADAAVTLFPTVPAPILGSAVGGEVPSTIRAADVDGNGTDDLAIAYQADEGVSANFSSGFAAEGFVIGTADVTPGGTFVDVSRLPVGTLIGPTNPNFQDPGNFFGNLIQRFNNNEFGNFQAPNVRGIVGFNFPGADGQTRYAWAEIVTSRTTGVAVLTGAYESIPNTAIVAGAIPEPTSLAVLGLGAVGLLARRRMAK